MHNGRQERTEVKSNCFGCKKISCYSHSPGRAAAHTGISCPGAPSAPDAPDASICRVIRGVCVCVCVCVCVRACVCVCLLVSCLGTDAQTGREPAAFYV